MSTLRLVIFDVDGTLVDSQNSIVASMDEAFAALNRDRPTRSEILSIVGLSLQGAFMRLAPWANSDEVHILVEAYKDSYARNRAGGRDGAPLYPGARAILDELGGRDDVLLGIATGKSARGLDILIETHGLHGMFQTVQVADHHPSKPHPSMIHAALSETGVDTGDAIMLGDTTFDMDMARAAGIDAIGVSWGYHSTDALTGAQARCVIDGFEDLLPVLDDLWGTT